MYAYIFIYTRVWVYKCPRVGEFSRAKMLTDYKVSHENRIAEREGALLPYFTRTGEHHVCIIRKGDPALRLLTNRGREKHLFALSVFARDYYFDVKTDKLYRHRVWQALGILS